MSSKIVLHADMGPQVLRFLSEYADLPETGVVAGQSVASAIDEVFGRHPAVINDVDVFRRVKQHPVSQPKANQTASRHKVTTLRQEDSIFGVPGYDDMARILRLVDTYSIQSVSRNGMLNYVNCVSPQGFDGLLTPGKILAGFDLNAVRVGVDLKSKKLVWDRDFEQFLATRQLQISMLHTPWHSMVRFLKKLETLPGVYGDVETAAEICASVGQSPFLRQMLKEGLISLMFGKVMHGNAEQHSSGWAPYFEMKEHAFRKIGEGWSERTAQATSAPPAEDDVTLWSLDARGSVDVAIQSRLDKLGAAVLTLGPRVVYESRRKKSASVHLKLKEVLSAFEERGNSPVAVNSQVMGTAYVEGQALIDVAERVERFLKKHGSFAGMLMGMRLEEQDQVIKRIRKVCKEFDGEMSLGVLEIHCGVADLLHDHALRDLLEWDREQAAKPIKVRPLVLPPLPRRFRGFVVEELLNGRQLRHEGSSMGHCVGGYHSLIRSNRRRIIRIRKSTGADKSCWSTLELGDAKHLDGSSGRAFSATARLVAIQHQARFNTTPNEQNKAVAAYVVLCHGRSVLYRVTLDMGLHKAWHESVMGVLRIAKKMTKELTSMAKRLTATIDNSSQEAVARLDLLEKAFGSPKLKAATPAPAVTWKDEEDGEIPF